MTTEIYTYADGELHGNYKRWHSNGQLAEETTYVNGRKHNSHKEWYANGKLKGEYNFENGKLTNMKTWDNEGELIMKAVYVHH